MFSFAKLIHAGMREDTPRALADKLYLTNMICLTLALITYPYALIFHWVGEPVLGWLVLPIASSYFGMIALNHRGHHQLARASVILMFNTTVTIYSLGLGEQAAIDLLFFPLSFIPLIIYERHELARIVAGAVLPGVLAVSLKLVWRHWSWTIGLPSATQEYVQLALVPTTFILLLVPLVYLLRANGRSAAALQSSVARYQRENAYLSLLQRTALAASAEADIEATVRHFLSQICRFLDVAVGHAFLVDEEAGKVNLRAMNIWVFDQGEPLTPFVEATKKLGPLGDSAFLPTALGSGQPVWVEALVEPQSYGLRFATCTKNTGALAVPASTPAGVVAVLEFVSPGKPLKAADPELISVLGSLGTQLGTAILKAKIEAARQAQEAARLSAERVVNSQREQMLTGAKMSALGEMAGNIAHEINNPLAIIRGRAQNIRTLMKREAPDLERIKTFVNEMDETAARIAAIVRGMRTLSRNGEQDPFAPVGLQEIIDGTLALCKERFHHNGVTLEAPPVDRDLILECRAVQISQVLINILGNAFDAVRELPERWVRLEVVRGESGLELAIVNSGPPIPAAVRIQLFQPFFTTKGVQKGTGLGLSISRSIAETHGGHLTLDSSSEFTRFVLSLPYRHETQRAA